MLDFIFGTVWGWIGTAGLVVIVCGAVGYLIPQFRIYAIGVAGIFISAASIYAKGARDRAKLEQQRKDQAVAKTTEQYHEIDARPDTADDVAERLRKHGF